MLVSLIEILIVIVPVLLSIAFMTIIERKVLGLLNKREICYKANLLNKTNSNNGTIYVSASFPVEVKNKNIKNKYINTKVSEIIVDSNKLSFSFYYKSATYYMTPSILYKSHLLLNHSDYNLRNNLAYINQDNIKIDRQEGKGIDYTFGEGVKPSGIALSGSAVELGTVKVLDPITKKKSLNSAVIKPTEYIGLLAASTIGVAGLLGPILYYSQVKDNTKHSLINIELSYNIITFIINHCVIYITILLFSLLLVFIYGNNKRIVRLLYEFFIRIKTLIFYSYYSQLNIIYFGTMYLQSDNEAIYYITLFGMRLLMGVSLTATTILLILHLIQKKDLLNKMKASLFSKFLHIVYDRYNNNSVVLYILIISQLALIYGLTTTLMSMEVK